MRRPTAAHIKLLTTARGRVTTRETTSGSQTTIYDAGGRNVGRVTTLDGSMAYSLMAFSAVATGRYILFVPSTARLTKP
jgi:hypothetical protein